MEAKRFSLPGVHGRSLSGFAWPWRRLVLTVALGVGMAFDSPLRAAIAIYTDSGSFTPTLQSGYYLNNFTGAGSGASLPYSGGTGPFAYTITASGSFGVTGVAMNAASGLGDSVSTFGQNAVLTFTFTGANKPTAVGGNFFWSDNSTPANVAAGTVRADVKIGGTSVQTLDISSTGNSSIGFGGFTTDGTAFDSITFTLVGYTSGAFYSTVDNFYVGNVNPVPEAGGWVAASFISIFVVGRTGWGFLCRRLARQ